ncbi:MAG: VWA domain-containing protein [Candidatus Obscuribacter sp.]|jgi:hypothetical protein|nr:VWA domain-containing protein [Candidatus Obscuribacter sp.]MBK7839818.1 VWA domain-containing protein [Candidatus Obscuribacter sp.]MBK9621527.1 VWA domain-containing protein [Candidatus Obscuribacter sp.]MBK9771908.1 VWA domain-containing protein [Candidatus Obscuribacter sp.]MBL0186138.1 VWA domain-containing protein [Candidatus Obscuribacter sp.]
MSSFNASVHQNQYLSQGASEVHAVLTVTSASGGAPVSSKALVVGLIADTSGSMSSDGKIGHARNAVIKAIEILPESAEFFVISAHSEGELVVDLCRATPENKARAIARVKQMKAEGGTYMSRWLTTALKVFKTRPGAINQAIMLTDGGCQDEDKPYLPKAIAACEGFFQCECRGVGNDFRPDELRAIASKLLGSVDMIRESGQIADDFRAIIEKQKGLSVSDVRIQLWMPQGAELMYVKQVSPEILDLTTKRSAGPNALTGRYPTGAWGEESRDYHICIKVTPGGVNQKMLAGRVALIVTENGQENKVAEAQVLAIWTDDEKLSAVINKQVANYTGQAELAAKIQEGLKAREAGDEAGATKALGRAMELAEQTGNEGTKKLLSKVVQVESDGTVKLKKAEKADVLDLDTKSVRTTRLGATKS